MNTCKTSLEDHTAVADDNLNENAVKPLVMPNQIPENQAGSGLCSVDMEVMSLRTVVKWQSTARQEVLFRRGGLTRSNCGPVCKIAEQTPHEDSSTPVPETGDSVVEVDTSLSYDDWSVKEGIKMSAGEEEHDIRVKVEDVTDSEVEGVEAEGKSDDDQEESSEFQDNQDNKEESRGSLDHISKIKDKPGSSDCEKSDEKDVNLEVKLVDITSQVESLIKKGDTEEKSAAKIKRLNTILKLLCDQRKSDEEEKQKAPAQSMIRKKLVKDGSSAKTEERGGGQSVVHKKEMSDSKEVTDVQREDDDSSKMKEVKDKTELVICEKQAEEDDKEEGGCSEENEGNEDKGESVIHKIDTVETIHLDTSHDLVIDESVCANGQIMKSVTFDLEHKEDDGLRNASSASLSVKTMHETLPRDDKEDSEKGNESLESSDTIPPEDIKNDDDEFDSEDDIPLTQNIQRPQYVKSEMQEGEDIEGVFSDNNTKPD